MARHHRESGNPEILAIDIRESSQDFLDSRPVSSTGLGGRSSAGMTGVGLAVTSSLNSHLGDHRQKGPICPDSASESGRAQQAGSRERGGTGQPTAFCLFTERPTHESTSRSRSILRSFPFLPRLVVVLGRGMASNRACTSSADVTPNRRSAVCNACWRLPGFSSCFTSRRKRRRRSARSLSIRCRQKSSALIGVSSCREFMAMAPPARGEAGLRETEGHPPAGRTWSCSSFQFSRAALGNRQRSRIDGPPLCR